MKIYSHLSQQFINEFTSLFSNYVKNNNTDIKDELFTFLSKETSVDFVEYFIDDVLFTGNYSLKSALHTINQSFIDEENFKM